MQKMEEDYIDHHHEYSLCSSFPLIDSEFYHHQQGFDEEVRYCLLQTRLELEATIMQSKEEIRRRECELVHLKDVLSRVIRDRDESRAQCQKLMLEKLQLQQQQQINQQINYQHHHDDHDELSSQDHHSGGNSATSNCSSSDEECDHEEKNKMMMSGDNDDELLKLVGEEILEKMKMKKIMKKKELPEKGKLLKAVMEAGPLLKTLLLPGGPLPQWHHPPPPLQSIHIPPFSHF